jgi:hypothetical protein
LGPVSLFIVSLWDHLLVALSERSAETLSAVYFSSEVLLSISAKERRWKLTSSCLGKLNV